MELFTLQKAPAVEESTVRKVEEKQKREEMESGVLLICLSHSAVYNELQLWLQIKTELFLFFWGDYLQSGAWMEV